MCCTVVPYVILGSGHAGVRLSERAEVYSFINICASHALLASCQCHIFNEVHVPLRRHMPCTAILLSEKGKVPRPSSCGVQT